MRNVIIALCLLLSLKTGLANHPHLKNGLDKKYTEAVWRGCMIRAMEIELDQITANVYCSCVLIKLDMYLQTHEPVKEEDLWNEIYVPCSGALRKES